MRTEVTQLSVNEETLAQENELPTNQKRYEKERQSISFIQTKRSLPAE